MKMTMRWYGTKFDSVTLQNIRQVPGIAGVITTLYDIPAGELWPLERIKAIKKEVEDAGLQICGIESVNIHDDIKIGFPAPRRGALFCKGATGGERLVVLPRRQTSARPKSAGKVFNTWRRPVLCVFCRT